MPTGPLAGRARTTTMRQSFTPALILRGGITMPTRREFVTGACAELAAVVLDPCAFGKEMEGIVETYVAEYKMAARDLRQA
jgi:hypothetical protein